jgi:general secretion pathway protein G
MDVRTHIAAPGNRLTRHATRRCRGFTLVELMLVTALIAIVGAVAVPTYQGAVERTRMRRAVADIGLLSLKLEKWDLNHGRLPNSLEEAGLADMRDPWGNPYRYLAVAGADRGQLRKDRNLVPINTDFDLYSAGRDGDTRPPLTAKPSRDDIVRANNGSFLGLAEEY